MNKVRKVLAVILSMIIIGTTLYAIVNWEHLNDVIKIIEYPDGCKERYVNGNITTPICEKERMMMSMINETRRLKLEIPDSLWKNLTK